MHQDLASEKCLSCLPIWTSHHCILSLGAREQKLKIVLWLCCLSFQLWQENGSAEHLNMKCEVMYLGCSSKGNVERQYGGKLRHVHHFKIKYKIWSTVWVGGDQWQKHTCNAKTKDSEYVIIEWFCLERSFATVVDVSGIKVKANNFLTHWSRNFNVPKVGFTVSK